MKKGTEIIEQDFRDALSRIKVRAPLHPKLVEMAKNGALKISASSVAMEAGHSRTLIGHDGCALSAVRSEIQDAIAEQPTRGGGESLRAEVRRLRIEFAEMKDAMEAAVVVDADSVVKAWNLKSGRAPDGSAVRRTSTKQRKSALRLIPDSSKKP